MAAADIRNIDQWDALRELNKGTSAHHKQTDNTMFNDSEGVTPTSTKQSADNLEKHFHNVYNREVEIDPSALDEIPDHEIMWDLADPPTFGEVKAAISKMNSSAKTGDGIAPAALKAISDNAKGLIAAMVIEIWKDPNKSVSEIPDEWHKNLLSIIFKGKGDKADPSNYRGVCLQAVLSKLTSSIIASRLNTLVEKTWD